MSDGVLNPPIPPNPTAVSRLRYDRSSSVMALRARQIRSQDLRHPDSTVGGPAQGGEIQAGSTGSTGSCAERALFGSPRHPGNYVTEGGSAPPGSSPEPVPPLRVSCTRPNHRPPPSSPDLPPRSRAERSKSGCHRRPKWTATNPGRSMPHDCDVVYVVMGTSFTQAQHAQLTTLPAMSAACSQECEWTH